MASMHLRGVGPGRLVGNVLAALKVDGAADVHRARICDRHRVDRQPHAGGRAGRAGTWLFAFIPVMFTYSGWNAADVCRRGDPRSRPQRAARAGDRHAGGDRDLPAAQRALSLRDSGRRARRASRAACSTWSPIGCSAPRAGNIMGVVSIVSLLASISAMTFAGPRVYYAMARDGVFFDARRARASALPDTGVSIVAQAIWSVAAGADRRAPTRSRPTPDSRSCCSPASPWPRCSCCAPRTERAAAVHGAAAIRSRRRSSPIASLLIVLNALWTDLVKPMTTGPPIGPSAAGLLVIALGTAPLLVVLQRKHQA